MTLALQWLALALLSGGDYATTVGELLHQVLRSVRSGAIVVFVNETAPLPK